MRIFFCCKDASALLNAVSADPVEMCHIVLDLTGTAFLSRFHNFIDIRHIQIYDTVTSGTDEMVMPVGIAVKTVSTSVCGDLHDLTKV